MEDQPQICYDLRFPVWARQQISPSAERFRSGEYDVLIYVTNWPQRRSHAWKTLLLRPRHLKTSAMLLSTG